MKRWRLPRRSRGWQIVRNLALAALTALFIWGLNWFPLPPRLEFRNMERRELIGPSEIQGIFQADGQWRVVGVREDQVIWTGGQDICFDSWPRDGEEPTLVPMMFQYYGPETEFEVMAVDVPQGTRSARLEAALDSWYYRENNGWTASGRKGGVLEDYAHPWELWERECRVEGELLEDGGVLFRIPILEDEWFSMESRLFQSLTWQETYRASAALRGVNCHMEAVFYGEDGQELGRAQLSTPEGVSDDVL